MSRSYRSLVANRRREYPHQVRLGEHALDWRLRYITHALIELELEGTRHWAQWYEPTGRPDASVSIYGFKDREHANSFYAWTLRSGIDWTVPPNEQEYRPASVPEHHFREAAPSTPAGRQRPD